MSAADRLAHIKPHDLIEIIAEHSRKFAHAAGVGAVETAGAVISYLAENPADLEPFINGGCAELSFDPGEPWLERGRLSWHSRTFGVIVHPVAAE